MSLSSRLLAITALLVVLAAIAVAGIGRWRGAALTDRLAQESLQSSEAVQRYFQDRRARELELISQLLASDRAFVAYIAQALSDGAASGSVDAASILDLINERRNQLGFDVALVLTPDGRVIADSRSPVTAPRDLSMLAPVAEALREVRATRGEWIDGDRALQVAIVPLLLGPTVEGLLLTGLEFDDELARDIARVSRTALLFTDGRGAQRRLLSSSLDLATAQQMLAALATHESSLAAIAAPTGSANLDLRLGNETWSARVLPLGTELEDALQVALVPPQQRDAIFSDIWQMMLWGAGAAVLVIMLVPLAISRSVLRPIALLADGAERAGRGDLPQPIRISGSGDIERLGRSINRVLGDLREMRDMESYVAEVWQKRGGGEVVPAAEPSGSELAPGTLFGGRYEIRRKIAEGGMGMVYVALDRELGEDVALKTLRSEWLETPSTIEQLKTEIRTARRITHPNVVRTFDFGQVGDVPFLSMEYVNGLTLRDALARTGRMRPYAALRVARQLCAGLGAAHRAGVLHCDIKPSNVMLEVNGNAKLMDFGVARAMGSGGDSRYPERQVAGTPRYTSPEQAQGREAREASDIYSLGVLLSELFTGNVPIDGDNSMEICIGHIQREPVRPSVFWPEIPPRLEALILKCLAKDPGQRYANTDALRDDLERLRF